MKKIANYYLAVSFFLILCGYSFAQQDYQIVQNFKAKHQQIEDAVKSAQSLDDLNNIQSQIDQLKNDYAGNKDLLDKSLYPDDFNGSIDKLSNAIDTRKGDFAQISTLKVQVSQIQVQLDSLNAKNADLLNQIEQIKETNGKDVARLAQTIAELKSSLAKRDKIIMSMLSGMLPGSNMENGSLTNKEKQQLYSESKKADIIANVKKAINDNVQFLSVTTLTPEDLSSMKKQQMEFENIWHNVGPAIVSVYSMKKENTKNVNEIDSSLASWNSSMDQVAWTSIRQKFSDKGISLNYFSNGEEFVQTVNSYIDDEIKNADSNGKDSKNMYSVFMDSVWTPKMRLAWIPFLISNKMLAGYDNDKMEAKIETWKNAVNPNNFIWLYVIIGFLVIIIAFSLIRAILHSRKGKLNQGVAEAKYHN